MKKIINYSAHYKSLPQNFTEQRTLIQNQNHTKNTAKPHKKKISRDRQEFINNISASGFKQFNL